MLPWQPVTALIPAEIKVGQTLFPVFFWCGASSAPPIKSQETTKCHQNDSALKTASDSNLPSFTVVCLCSETSQNSCHVWSTSCSVSTGSPSWPQNSNSSSSASSWGTERSRREPNPENRARLSVVMLKLFRLFVLNAQTPQNVSALCISSLTLREEFTAHNPASVPENSQHAPSFTPTWRTYIWYLHGTVQRCGGNLWMTSQ